MPTENQAASATEPVVCSRCESVGEDCNCAHCSNSSCGEPRETVCSHCDQCENCCDCAHCDRCGEAVESTCSRCDRCEGCCNCSYCEHCGDAVESTCSRCDRCTDGGCCNCSYCNSCSEVVGSTCGECDNCDHCCECNSEDRNGIEIFTRPLKFHPASRAERKRNPSPRFVSAEIEVASVGNDGYRVGEAVRRWSGSIVEDGSLPSTGFEINTSPAGGDKFVQQIEEICSALSYADAEVTSACGLHVHIDARDFSYYDIRRLVIAYAAIEDAIFEMVSPQRRRSTYARRCGVSLSETIARGRIPNKEVKKTVGSRVYAGMEEEGGEVRVHKLRKNKYCEVRYAALNLHSWFYRGTVECRLFGGTVRADKIIPWGMLWATILDWVTSHSDEDAEALTGTPRENLNKIVDGRPDLQQFIEARIARFAHSSED